MSAILAGEQNTHVPGDDIVVHLDCARFEADSVLEHQVHTKHCSKPQLVLIGLGIGLGGLVDKAD